MSERKIGERSYFVIYRDGYSEEGPFANYRDARKWVKEHHDKGLDMVLGIEFRHLQYKAPE